MRIDNWMRIDNLPLNIGNNLSYIREDAELLGNVEECIIEQYVQDTLEKDFPQFFKELRYDDVVYTEYYPFERDCYMSEDEFPGYAVYIHFQKELVTKLYNHVLDKQPDYVLSYLDWMSKPLDKV